MRLKMTVVLAITALSLTLGCALSLTLSVQLLHQRSSQAYATNSMIAHQVLFATATAIRRDIRRPNLGNPRALRDEVAEALRSDTALNTLMRQSVRYSPTTLDVTIADAEGPELDSTNYGTLDQRLPSRPEYAEFQRRGELGLLRLAFGPPRVYEVTLPLERNSEPFATVRVGFSASYLHSLSN
ncbi:MAG: PDC sensor domain-containing protein [Acidobacteriaceae bacterium]